VALVGHCPVGVDPCSLDSPASFHPSDEDETSDEDDFVHLAKAVWLTWKEKVLFGTYGRPLFQIFPDFSASQAAVFGVLPIGDGVLPCPFVVILCGVGALPEECLAISFFK
jgi:hypothetical protein